MFKHKTLARAFVSTLAVAVLALVIPVGAAFAALNAASPSSGPVGSSVIISAPAGSFSATSSGTIQFAPATSFAGAAQAVTFGTDGSLPATTITVPTAPIGQYNIVVTPTTGAAVSTPFTITPAIAVSTTVVQVGQQLYVTGTGFGANSNVTVTYDGAIVASALSTSYGSFGPVYFTVPSGTTISGTIHTVSATDAYGHYATASVTVQQSVTVTPNSGAVGTSVTIAGTGFGAYRGVTITFGTTSMYNVVTTSAAGSFSTTFTVPALTTHTVTVTANDGIISASTSFSLVAGMTLTPTTGTSGTSVTASGTGFSGSATVSLRIDGTQIATTATDSNGNFSTSLSIPASAGGSHTITASDGVYSATATFTVKSQLSVSPATGAVGSQVTVTGSGFGANAPVTVNFDNTQVTTATAGATGGLSASFAVPATAGGVHNVTATDGTNSATAQFTTSAQILLNPKSGPTGQQVTISGNGFVANSSITVKFNNAQVKTSVAGTTGSLSDQFAAPDLNAGTYTVSASDGVNTASATFVVTSSMNVSPATGYVGSQISVTGTGFNGPVTIKYDNNTVASTTADSSGTFTASFSAPVSLHGDHTILATDGTVTLQRTFSVSSTPPPVPQLLLPASGSTQNSRPTFSWTSVSDPSGVTYDLQISTDPSFSSPIVNETGLTTTQYQLTSSQSLKGASSSSPYYWRVKAVDQASNESAFTTPNTFGVSTFPAWAMWLLIGIGALVVLLLVLWVGIRMGRRTTE